MEPLPATPERSPAAIPRTTLPLYRRLYVQVLCAIFAGALLGSLRPELAQQMKPLGDVFIKLIKMMIEPIIFTTVVVGVAKMGNMKEVGRVGLKALVYFEVVSGIALLIGLMVANLFKPGSGLHIDWASLDQTALAGVPAAPHVSAIDFVMHIVPDTIVGAFARGETLQVVFISVLFGLGVSTLGASWQQQLGIFVFLLLTSKGSAAVTGGGFVTLAATLTTIKALPVAGLALLFGVDRFMSEARAITNLIGNGVATIVVAAWEGALDRDRLQRMLNEPN
jgi:Na+/H+-dicarboxylate symporter